MKKSDLIILVYGEDTKYLHPKSAENFSREDFEINLKQKTWSYKTEKIF